jgi:hypothetical protein
MMKKYVLKIGPNSTHRELKLRLYRETDTVLDKNNERPDWMTNLKHTDTAW